MRTEIFDWSKRGGKWFEIGHGFCVLYYVFWAQWVFGIEFMPTGSALFLGPLTIAIGRPVE